MTVIYSDLIIEGLNKFLSKLDNLKNEFDIDYDTTDKYVLTPREGDNYVPVRKSVHETRMKNMKNKHFDSDPYGEEIWEDENN